MNKLSSKALFLFMFGKIIILMLFIFVTVIAYLLTNVEYGLLSLYIGIPIIILQLIYTIVFGILQKNNYGYQIDDEKIIIKSGVIFRSLYYIPYLQIQDIGSIEGPIQLLVGTKTIHISTAGSDKDILFLDKNVCDELLEKIYPLVQKRLEKSDSDASL